ncbi:MAG: tRNA (adenosine(37)-N6)-threonylcarbamoyltransferase complex ATPase subunit type 1 TsaE [Candidatus Paceibacterota bacterium]|jgi:tRNA threonylcarbamoyladenosine biosynthesis protein TsaE
MVFKSTSANNTKQFAVQIAKKIKKLPKKNEGACIVALIGDLGAGKTTFIQGFVKEFGITRRITSPTFLLMKRYALKNEMFKNLYHLDAYRVAELQELSPLGIEAILENPQNLVLVEWADNIKGKQLRHAIQLVFKHGKKENERSILIHDA